MMPTRTGKLPIVVAVGLVLLAACSPRPDQAASGAAGPTAPSRPPKTLTIAIQSELQGFILELTQDNSRVGGVKQPKPIVHNLLTAENDKGVWIPELAEAQISVERGTWQLNPDGTMDTTWKIRPGVKWHDGAPFTTDDLLFSFAVFRDPEVTNRVGTPARLMTGATAPDGQTLVVRWSTPYVEADQAPGLAPLPGHLLEETYRASRTDFGNSPRLSTDFVGLGPYKLAHWEHGSHIEFARFDDYFRGRPPLDRVTVRFLGDPNTIVANILAESVDVVLPPAVDLEAALDVRQRWAGTGHQVLVGPSGNFRYLNPQLRPEYARPTNGLTDPLVRRALAHAMDRQALVDVLSDGLAPVADSWISPSSPIRGQVDSAIPRYPHDLTQAGELLAEAGWVRGPDGILVDQRTGERFELEINGGATRYIEREQQIVGDAWKRVGAQTSFFSLPPALANVLENRVTRPGAGIYAIGEARYHTVPHTKFVGSPQNRWSGSNYGGYSNLQVDSLIDRLEATIPMSDRVALIRDMLRIVMGDVVIWPMYWDLTDVLALKGVKGIPGGEGGYHTWNFFEWDKE